MATLTSTARRASPREAFLFHPLCILLFAAGFAQKRRNAVRNPRTV